MQCNSIAVFDRESSDVQSTGIQISFQNQPYLVPSKCFFEFWIILLLPKAISHGCMAGPHASIPLDFGAEFLGLNMAVQIDYSNAFVHSALQRLSLKVL